MDRPSEGNHEQSLAKQEAEGDRESDLLAKEQELREKDDLKRWDWQIEGHHLRATSDDALGEKNEAIQHIAHEKKIVRDLEAGLSLDPAQDEQLRSERLAREKMSDVVERMPDQDRKLMHQIDSENPAEILADRALATLTQMVNEGRLAPLPLLGIDVREDSYRGAIIELFEKLGLDDPMEQLDRVKKTLFGIDKHTTTAVETHLNVANRDAIISAQRKWDSESSSYYYELSGGVSNRNLKSRLDSKIL